MRWPSTCRSSSATRTRGPSPSGSSPRRLAYDELLAEACRLAGVEVGPHAKGDPAERFREEVELASRGWAW
ncbi:hypothetical protein [Cellulomonas soli]